MLPNSTALMMLKLCKDSESQNRRMESMPAPACSDEFKLPIENNRFQDNLVVYEYYNTDAAMNDSCGTSSGSSAQCETNKNHMDIDINSLEVFTANGLNLQDIFPTNKDITDTDNINKELHVLSNVIIETENIVSNNSTEERVYVENEDEEQELGQHKETTVLADLDFQTKDIELTISDDENNSDVPYIPDTDQMDSEENEEGKQNSTWSLKNRRERKKNRNNGMQYTTVKGGIRKERKQRDLKACKKNCRERISEEERKNVFDLYWSLGSYEKRVRFVAECVTIKSKSICRTKVESKQHKNREYTYFYHLQNVQNNLREPVCKDCFLNILDETNKFVYRAVRNKLESPLRVPHGDLRGKHSKNSLSEDTLDKVRNHILSFPSYESHYTCRHTKKKYLASHLNLSIMHELYQKAEENPVSISTYRKMFAKTGLKFKKPALDTCGTCDSLALLKRSKEDTIRAEAEKKLKQHHIDADLAYQRKTEDKNIAKESPHMKVFTFDLQQVLPTPLLTSGEVFYKRQYSVYNLTIHDCVSGQAVHYMWGESTAKRGSIEIASCLYHLLTNMPSEIKHVIFYSDTCGGQNKNSNVIAMFMYVLKYHPTLETIEHKFLIAGHTRMECDSDHSLIERKSKRSPFPIQLPRDWFQLVRTAAKNNRFEVKVMARENFLDFPDLFKKYLQKKKLDCTQEQLFNFRNIKWVRFGKDFGLFEYKTDLDNLTDFKRMSYQRKKHLEMPINYELPRPYKQPLPISVKKKENLVSLFDKIDPDARDFYANLPTENMADIDPDLDRLEGEDE